MNMDFLKNLDMRPMQAFKLALIGVVGLVVLVFALKIVATTFAPLASQMGVPSIGATAPGYGGYAYDSDNSASSYYEMKGEGGSSAQLSARNVVGSMPYPMPPQSPTGNTAEQFEVQQYSATIETRKLEQTCDAFTELKTREDVIFENSNTYDRGCNYTFKVEKKSVEDVLAWLKDLNPKELSDNTYTIKRQVDDFTSEVEVLENKRASIDATLASALRAYDGITTLATQTQNADALAKIIDSRIGIIERLTQERININEQLDRLARAKAEQLDRLDYTYFSVNVYENKFVDGKEIKESWKAAIKDFVRDINKIVQDLTIGLVLLLILIAQWILYALIALIIAKYAWRIGKYLWYR